MGEAVTWLISKLLTRILGLAVGRGMAIVGLEETAIMFIGNRYDTRTFSIWCTGAASEQPQLLWQTTHARMAAHSNERENNVPGSVG